MDALTPDLSPTELEALRRVKLRALSDRGDLFPMMHWLDRMDPPVVIPLIDAINLDVEIGR